MTSPSAVRPGAAESVRSVRFWGRHALLNSRLVGTQYLRTRPNYAQQLLTPRTRLVIEGFPRSANSFARFAVHVSQGDPRVLAGHNHSSAFVRKVVAARIPTIVIVREPEAAVASFLQAEPVWPWLAFRAYDLFHRHVLDVADGVLFVPFRSVIDDFEGVLEQARRRFEVDLATYDDSEATRAEVARRVEESNRALSGGTIDEAWVSRPSTARRSAEEVLAELSQRDRDHRDRARATYATVRDLFPA